MCTQVTQDELKDAFIGMCETVLRRNCSLDRFLKLCQDMDSQGSYQGLDNGMESHDSCAANALP